MISVESKNEILTPSLNNESPHQSAEIKAVDPSLDLATILQIVTELQSENKELVKRVVQLESALAALTRPVADTLIQADLPESQKAVLQAILDLPEDAFADAEKLIATIEGQAMTEAFCNSIKAILKLKKWGVCCETCNKPSTLLWHKNKRCAEKGSAEFSHIGTSHGGTTRIKKFQFVGKKDQRKKQNKL